jgi:hypothetical protein
MKRLLFGVVLGCVVFVVHQNGGSAQQSPSSSATSSPVAIHATSISDLRVWDAFVTEQSRSGSLRL